MSMDKDFRYSNYEVPFLHKFSFTQIFNGIYFPSPSLSFTALDLKKMLSEFMLIKTNKIFINLLPV